MDEDIRIRGIQPYPGKGENNGKSRKPRPGENGEEENEDRPLLPERDDSQVDDGHIDTRVAPW